MIPIWAIALILVAGVGVTMITVSVTVSTPDSSEVILECYGMFNGTTMYTDTVLSIPWNTQVRIPCKANVETVEQMNYTEAFCNKTGDTFVLDRGYPCETNASHNCDHFTPRSNEYIIYTHPNNVRHVDIYCNDGYSMVGTASAICVSTKVGTLVTSMEWNPVDIEQSSSCMAGTCRTIAIQNAVISDPTLTTGQYANISCEPDFYLSDATLSKVYCNAVFNSSQVNLTALPRCISYQCAPVSLTIANSRQFDPGPVDVKSMAFMTCNDGYAVSPFGAMTDMQCNYTFTNATVKILGYTNVSFTCVPANCSVLTVLNSDTTNVTLGLHDTKKIACKAGYQLFPVPNQVVTCHPSETSIAGELTPTNSECRLSQCPILAAVANGKWNNTAGDFAAANVKTVAILTCNAGYKVSSSGTMTCTGKLNDASFWSPALPKCIL